jgi:HlyD family secretion protein
MKKIVIVLIVLGVIGLLAWASSKEKIAEVTLISIERGQVQKTISNTRAGTVKACQRSKLSMPVGGRVSKLFVNEGDLVTEGQILLQLWNLDQLARTHQAEASLKTVALKEKQTCLNAKFDRRESDRLQSLVVRNLASVDKADNAKTRAETSEIACAAAKADKEVAQASLELQQALLELTQLKAPFAGVIAEINGEVGEYVTPSPPGVATPPAVDLINTQCLYVTAPIDEVDAMPLRLGLPAEISLDAFGDRTFAGKLIRIAPYVLDLEKQARTVDVDIEFTPAPEDVALLVGYSADISIVLESRDDVLRVPTEAVLEDDQVMLYQQESGELEQRQFKPGISNWSFTEAVDGLKTGDRIVLSLDAPGVEAGARVTPKND